MSNINLISSKKWKAEDASMWIWLCCLAISALFLLLGTKSSPLYPFNDWGDANAYFTMGKGMMNGRIPFRDLFEQKGPFLYLIYGFAYLISPKSFFGVYLLETLFFSMVLYYGYRTVSLFVKTNYSILSIPITAAFIINLKSFTHGGGAEEFCLPMLAFSLFSLLRHWNRPQGDNFPAVEVIANGIAAGCVLWVKFTLLGFWIGWILSVGFSISINKGMKNLINFMALFAVGILIATIPWVIYFGIHRAIGFWFYTYFVINLTLYPKITTFLQSITYIFSQLLRQFEMNRVLILFWWAGVILFLMKREMIQDGQKRFFLLGCLIFLIVGIFGGGRGFVYSSLMLAPFCVFFISIFIKFLEAKLLNNSLVFTPLFLSTLIMLWFVTLNINHNVYMMKIEKEDLVQFKFAPLILQKEDATLLNYDALDLGFYTVTGITPATKYFERNNFSYSKYPVIEDQQDWYLSQRLVDFVVMQTNPGDDTYKTNSILNSNYELIASGLQIFEGKYYNYFLLGKKK